MGLTVTWIVVNLIFPVILPLIAMLFAGWFLCTTPEQKANAKVKKTVQDGQLGWLAIAWSALALYEAWDHLETHADFFRFVVAISVSEAGIIFGALFISVGGAMTASDTERVQKRYMLWSIIVTVISATVFSIVHWKTT